MIHIFGDSHTVIYKGVPLEVGVGFHPVSSEIIVHYLGATTMHRIGRDGIPLSDHATRGGAAGYPFCAAHPEPQSKDPGSAFRAHGVKDGDFVVFVNGEIDIRCHVGVQRDRIHRNEDEILKTLAVNYLQKIHEEAAFFDSITCAVRFVIPVVEKGLVTKRRPIYGTDGDRACLVNKLNDLLKSESSRYDILYIDGYDEFVTEDGFLSPAYQSEKGADDHHFGNNAIPFLIGGLLSLVTAFVSAGA